MDEGIQPLIRRKVSRCWRMWPDADWDSVIAALPAGTAELVRAAKRADAETEREGARDRSVGSRR